MPASKPRLNASVVSWEVLERAPTHPGAMVKDGILEAFGLTQGELAEAIGMSRLSINEIVRGKRSLTEGTALRLARLTNTSPEMWLNLQRDFDLWKAKKDERVALSRIKPLARPGSRRL